MYRRMFYSYARTGMYRKSTSRCAFLYLTFTETGALAEALRLQTHLPACSSQLRF